MIKNHPSEKLFFVGMAGHPSSHLLRSDIFAIGQCPWTLLLTPEVRQTSAFPYYRALWENKIIEK